MIRESILSAIGNTPVVRLRKLAPPAGAQVVVKLEYYNPTGSYKDRMALAMIEGAEGRGDLRPGVRVIEYTGGSTGTSLAFVCAVKGYQFIALSSDAWSAEKLKSMRAFGAEVRIFPSEGGKITPALIQQLRAEAERLSAEPATLTRTADPVNCPDMLGSVELEPPLGDVGDPLQPDSKVTSVAPEATWQAPAQN